MRAYCFYTKAMDFLVFCGFFWKPKDPGVSLGSRDQGYDLNKFQNGRNGGHFGGARTPLSLLLGNVLQPICGPIVFIRNLSIFSFSVGFSKKQRHLELVWVPGDRVMSSICLKMGKNAVISEERVALSLYYYAKFYSLYAGLLLTKTQKKLYWNCCCNFHLASYAKNSKEEFLVLYLG